MHSDRFVAVGLQPVPGLRPHITAYVRGEQRKVGIR